MKVYWNGIRVTKTSGYPKIRIYGLTIEILANFKPVSSPKNETFLHPTVFDILVDFHHIKSEGWNSWLADETINTILENFIREVID